MFKLMCFLAFVALFVSCESKLCNPPVTGGCSEQYNGYRYNSKINFCERFSTCDSNIYQDLAICESNCVVQIG